MNVIYNNMAYLWIFMLTCMFIPMQNCSDVSFAPEVAPVSPMADSFIAGVIDDVTQGVTDDDEDVVPLNTIPSLNDSSEVGDTIGTDIPTTDIPTDDTGTNGDSNSDGTLGTSGPPTSQDSPDSLDEEEINDVCQTLNLKTQTESVIFPATDRQFTCSWGVGGNLDPRNRYFQARYEQNYSFSLPVGSIVCSMSLDSPVTNMIYDDHFMVHFDNSVLASSHTPLINLLSAKGGIPQYDWSAIAGQYWSGGSGGGNYCLGAANNDSNCSWPKTESQGSMTLSIGSSTIQSIIALDPTRNTHQLSFVTIGDNDDRDCEHSKIGFTVNISYVTP